MPNKLPGDADLGIILTVVWFQSTRNLYTFHRVLGAPPLPIVFLLRMQPESFTGKDFVLVHSSEEFELNLLMFLL